MNELIEKNKALKNQLIQKAPQKIKPKVVTSQEVFHKKRVQKVHTLPNSKNLDQLSILKKSFTNASATNSEKQELLRGLEGLEEALLASREQYAEAMQNSR